MSVKKSFRKVKRVYRRYTVAEKRESIRLYESGIGCDSIAKALWISNVRRILHWVTAHRSLGERGLQKQPYRTVSIDVKQSAVRQVLEKLLSCEQAALQYGVSESSVYNWVCKVKTDGYCSLSEVKPRGRPPKAMGRPKKKEPQTELERLQAENQRLKTEVALLKKVKALVEQRDARLRETGRGPSKN